MGDGGSQVIGFIVAYMAVRLWVNNPLEAVLEGGEGYNYSLVAALSVLVVPCFDTLTVMAIRMKNRVSIFQPDTNHIHFRLLNCGLSPAKVLLFIAAVSLFFIALNFVQAQQQLALTYIALGDALVWILLQILITKKILKHNKI